MFKKINTKIKLKSGHITLHLSLSLSLSLSLLNMPLYVYSTVENIIPFTSFAIFELQICTCIEFNQSVLFYKD